MQIPHKLPYPAQGSVDTPADKITLIAQRYAGYFIGHPYSFDQQAGWQVQIDPTKRGIHVEKKAWKEPVVLADDCEFCKRLTDESAESRVAGFQHQIDIEVLRVKTGFYHTWLEECGPDVVEFLERDIELETEDEGSATVRVACGRENSAANRRAFIRTEQDKPRLTRSGANRPDGWMQKALPMVDLPLRLKRKMCIEWNHVYVEYLEQNPTVIYDFERKDFFMEMPELGPSECCDGMQAYGPRGKIVILHNEGCAIPLEAVQAGALGMIHAMFGFGSL